MVLREGEYFEAMGMTPLQRVEKAQGDLNNIPQATNKGAVATESTLEYEQRTTCRLTEFGLSSMGHQ